MGMNQKHVSAQERSVVGDVRVRGEMNAEDAPLGGEGRGQRRQW